MTPREPEGERGLVGSVDYDLEERWLVRVEERPAGRGTVIVHEVDEMHPTTERCGICRLVRTAEWAEDLIAYGDKMAHDLWWDWEASGGPQSMRSEWENIKRSFREQTSERS